MMRAFTLFQQTVPQPFFTIDMTLEAWLISDEVLWEEAQYPNEVEYILCSCDRIQRYVPTEAYCCDVCGETNPNHVKFLSPHK